MRLNNTYRQKLLHAIIYFTKNVKKPSKLKIFKLLYFLDFEHFRLTGKNVTGLDYYAMEFGPVPLELFGQISDNRVPKDFSEFISIMEYENKDEKKKGGLFRTKKSAKIDMDVFSPREQALMKQLAEIYLDADANMISGISHIKNHPWDKTVNSLGLGKKIDYSLALEKESESFIEEALIYVKEREEMLKAFPPKENI